MEPNKPEENGRYQNGKIYKLVNDVDDEIYVGSTCTILAKRLGQHKRDSRKRPSTPVYKHLNEIGWDNVSIILIEKFPCKDREELFQRERYWFDALKPTLNTKRPIIVSPEEKREQDRIKERKYHEKNREKIKERQRLYHLAHAEERRQKARKYGADRRQADRAKVIEQERIRGKRYRENNREKIKERNAKYKEANRDKINEKRRLQRKQLKEQQQEQQQPEQQQPEQQQ